MENIGTIISILVGLVTLLSMLVWFGRFIQRVNVHDKKLDESLVTCMILKSWLQSTTQKWMLYLKMLALFV